MCLLGTEFGMINNLGRKKDDQFLLPLLANISQLLVFAEVHWQVLYYRSTRIYCQILIDVKSP